MSANTIRRHREKRRWTLDQLAGLIGTDKSHLSRIERGLVTPYGIMRERIADALGVPREDLFSDEAEDVPA